MTRKVKNSKKIHSLSKISYKYVVCSKCNIEEIKVASEIESAICWLCCQKMVEPPVQLKTIEKKIKRPRGWHFMEVFVDQDGTVFHKGVEQPDLKGTLEPTLIKKDKKPNKKLSGYEKIKKEEKELKKLVKQHKKAKEEKKENESSSNDYANRPKGLRKRGRPKKNS